MDEHTKDVGFLHGGMLFCSRIGVFRDLLPLPKQEVYRHLPFLLQLHKSRHIVLVIGLNPELRDVPFPCHECADHPHLS